MKRLRLRRFRLLGSVLLAWAATTSSAPLQPDWELGQRLPADSLLYVSTANVADIRAAYKQTGLYQIWEKLPLPPEIKDSGPMDTELVKQLGLGSEQLFALFAGTLSLGVADFDPEAIKQGKPPALVLRAGLGDTSLVSQFAPKLDALLVEGLGEMKQEDWEGTDVRRYGKDTGPNVYTTFAGPVFYLATDADLLKRTLAGPTIQSLVRSSGFTAAQEKIGREGEIFVYANLKRAIAKVKLVVMQEGVEAAQTWSALGLDSLGWIATGSSLREGRFLDRCFLSFGDPPTGALALLSGMQAGPVESLGLIPAGSTLAFAVNLESFPSVMERVLGFARKHAPPGTEEEMQAGFAEAGKELGIDLRAQLLDLLAGEVAFATRVPEINPGVVDNPLLLGGLLPELRMTLLLELTDAAAFDATLKLLLEKQGQQATAADYKGVSIQTLNVPGSPVPTAWAYVGKWFVVGPGSASVEQVIDAQAGGTGLAKSKDWEALGTDGAHLVTYVDLGRILDVGGGVALPQLQKLQPGFDWAKVPKLSELAALLSPASSVAKLGAQGWALESLSPIGGMYSSMQPGIIAAIAIPSLMRSRLSANEASATGALRTLAAAQTDYNNNSDPHVFADSLQKLATGEGAGGVRYIDDALAAGTKSGYVFTMEASDGGWYAEAHPVEYRKTGVRSFYIDFTGLLLGGDNGGQPGTPDLPEI